MHIVPRSVLALVTAVITLSASPAIAQTFIAEPEARGTSYFVFAEPGAPTVEVVILGTGVKNGIYKFQVGISLVDALALAGGTARSDSTALGTTTTTIRMIRETAGSYIDVYESTPEMMVRNRAGLPALQTGDTIEVTTTFEAAEKKFSIGDALGVASRVASLVSLVFLVIRRF